MDTETLSPEGIDKRLEELQKELIEKANDKQNYDAIADEIFRLRSQKQQSLMNAEVQKENLKRVKELQDFIASQSTEITEFDEALVRIRATTAYGSILPRVLLTALVVMWIWTTPMWIILPLSRTAASTTLQSLRLMTASLPLLLRSLRQRP